MSSKKPFDHIDEKIKQAAENSLPAFDEKAWQAMEAKLDKDQKKRRPVLWWFILPLVLAGSWGVYYTYNKHIDETKTVTSKETQKSKSDTKELAGNSVTAAPTGDAESVKTILDSDQNSIAGGNKPTAQINNQQVPESSLHGDAVSEKSNTTLVSRRKRLAGKRNSSTRSVVTSAEAEDAEATQKNGSENLPQKDVAVNEAELEKAEKEALPLNNAEQKNEAPKPEAAATEKQIVQTEAVKEGNPAEKKKEKQQHKKQPNGIYLLAAGGADAGSTRLFSFANSNITPKYGIGIGYRFNKRWSVQTGFYAANKKYVAKSGDYKFKPGSPMSTYTIEKIKAACLVYEIPVTVRYDIVNRPSFMLYATGGAASYIIQKEKYNCSYWYYNNIYEQEWKYSGNRHLFSTAMFSVGIEKPLTSTLSLLAEPSFSVPLSGVGDGKMRVYSAAALVGIKYYPFKK